MMGRSSIEPLRAPGPATSAVSTASIALRRTIMKQPLTIGIGLTLRFAPAASIKSRRS